MPTGDETLVDSSRMTPALLQRLALARAVYAEREIYLLDDPLSAMDSASADRIFQSAIVGALKGKTVILATNREQVGVCSKAAAAASPQLGLATGVCAGWSSDSNAAC